MAFFTTSRWSGCQGRGSALKLLSGPRGAEGGGACLEVMGGFKLFTLLLAHMGEELRGLASRGAQKEEGETTLSSENHPEPSFPTVGEGRELHLSV